MPFKSVDELPERVRSKFGAKAQRAFMGAFNSAFEGTCKDRDDREGCAFAIATTAADNVQEKSMRKAFSNLMKSLGEIIGTNGDDELDKALHQHGPGDCPEGTKWDAEKGVCVKIEKQFGEQPEPMPKTERRFEVESETETTTTTHSVTRTKESAITKRARILKADEEKQILYSPALVPDEQDSQGDTISKEYIEETAHLFLSEYPLYKEEMGVGIQHESREPLGHERVHIVESWLEKQDVIYETPRGPEKIPEGTWMLGIKVNDPDLWRDAKAAKYTGLSIEGVGVRTPVAV